MVKPKLLEKWIHLSVHDCRNLSDEEPPEYVHELLNKINHTCAIPSSHQRVSCIDTVRHMGQKFRKQFIWPIQSVCVCVKGHLFYYFCTLSVCTAAEALIRRASDALCSIFQRVIVRHRWGIDKCESSEKDLYVGWACNPVVPKQRAPLFLSICEVCVASSQMLWKLVGGYVLAMDKHGNPDLYSGALASV